MVLLSLSTAVLQRFAFYQHSGTRPCVDSLEIIISACLWFGIASHYQDIALDQVNATMYVDQWTSAPPTAVLHLMSTKL
ncbi:hypothetical protein EDD17DRAFT_1531545 [Pisolithus thermaeus]|nr:hypothetical protein EV401DRAFT_1946704 [Pisolithus croceorrhizus]KAI6168049.1 hypothetical protein EDD17DRAFT_1531545 [Pisolithus thermaeus]